MRRRGCSLPASASGFEPHRASISSRFGQVPRAGVPRGDRMGRPDGSVLGAVCLTTSVTQVC
jgi:hypothetical protein